MSELSDNIRRLYDEGNSYSEIVEKLSCAKSTVSYHCGPEQKNRSASRQRSRRETNTMVAKVDRFKQDVVYGDTKEPTSTPKDRERFKALDFQRNGSRGNRESSFLFQDVLDKIGESPVCYLSGRPIDLENARSYELDHVIPRSRGGDNSLDNLGVTTREINRAKGRLTNEEFILMCIDVVKHNGYTILKNE